jgi:enoyl-CoA hydratase/carnithine racemase
MSADVSIRQQGGLGRITLTRPSALHALNTPMCAAILEAVTRWAADPSIQLVWIDHQEGTRGFCAGGDIRMLAESGAGDASEARDFFRTEYRMNAALEAFPKPILALIDGVTMGGGVGLSAQESDLREVVEGPYYRDAEVAAEEKAGEEEEEKEAEQEAREEEEETEAAPTTTDDGAAEAEAPSAAPPPPPPTPRSI